MMGLRRFRNAPQLTGSIDRGDRLLQERDLFRNVGTNLLARNAISESGDGRSSRGLWPSEVLP